MGAKRSPFPGQRESQEHAKGAIRNLQPVSFVAFSWQNKQSATLKG
jgi:hypothetical protein